VYSKLGTSFAVEEVIKTYFGDGRVEEWFEYDGEPYHFKVYATDPTIATTRQAEFLQILEVVKRKSMVLDEIIIGLSSNITNHINTGYVEFVKETTTIIPKG
jgi:P2-related tail formation protein